MVRIARPSKRKTPMTTEADIDRGTQETSRSPGKRTIKPGHKAPFIKHETYKKAAAKPERPILLIPTIKSPAGQSLGSQKKPRYGATKKKQAPVKTKGFLHEPIKWE